MKIYCVILLYSRVEYLREMVSNLAESGNLAGFVVVNNSHNRQMIDAINALDLFDATLSSDALETSSTACGKEVVYIGTQANVGCPGGFAIGMDKALQLGADWIYLLDDDAVPVPGALDALVENIPGQDDVAAVASQEVLPDGEIVYSHRARCDIKKLYPGFSIPLEPARYAPGQVEPIDLAAWAGLMVNAKAVKQVGLPREELFLTYCDHEYSLRLKGYGSIHLVTDSVLTHYMDTTYKNAEQVSTKNPAVSFVPIQQTWRHFFVWRNKIWVGRRYSKRRFRLYQTIFKLYFSDLKKIVKYQDHKKTRLKLRTAALVQGLTGRFDNGYPFRMLEKVRA